MRELSNDEVPRLLRHREGAFSWWIEPAAAELAAPGVLPGARPPPDARILRETKGRTVYAAQLSNGSRVVVKAFRDVVMVDRLRRFMRTRAAAEWHALGKVTRLGVAAPRRLALGESDSESVLVLAEMTSHEPLSTALERLSRLSPRRRIRIVNGVADLIASMHDAGLQHRDLHPGNIMVPGAGVDQLSFECAILDLHHGRWSQKLPLLRRLEDLGDLDLFFAWHGGRCDRVRFARRYLSTLAGGILPADESELGAAIDAIVRRVGSRTLRNSREFWSRRQARARAPGRIFNRFQFEDGARGLLRRDAAWIEPLLVNADEVLARPDSRVLKTGKSTTSALVAAGERGEIFMKRYNRAGTRETAKILVRGTRGRRALLASWALEVRGVATPPVLGCLDRKDSLSVVVTEARSGARNLADLVGAAGEGVAPLDEWLPRTMRTIARLLKRMHVGGASHRDLKTTNLLCECAIDDAGCVRPTGAIELVDLDGVTARATLPSWRRRGRDLARLLEDATRRGALTGDAAASVFLDDYLVHIVDERRQRAQLDEAISAWLRERVR